MPATYLKDELYGLVRDDPSIFEFLPIRMIGAHTDLTPLMRVQEELSRANAQLKQSVDDLECFAWAVSHDLRAPLRGVHQVAEVLGELLGDDDDPEVTKFLGLMQRRVTRLQNLLDSLLEFARAGRATTAIEPVSLRSICAEVWHTAAAPAGFRFTCELDVDTVEAPRGVLVQVLQNLVHNAVKHHPRADGHVEVRAIVRGERAHITVADDGDGIAEGFEQRIFGLFEKLDRRDVVEGSGMGLAIVKRAIERAGGRIDVANRPAGGCAFTFTWPLRWSVDEPTRVRGSRRQTSANHPIAERAQSRPSSSSTPTRSK